MAHQSSDRRLQAPRRRQRLKEKISSSGRFPQRRRPPQGGAAAVAGTRRAAALATVSAGGGCGNEADGWRPRRAMGAGKARGTVRVRRGTCGRERRGAPRPAKGGGAVAAGDGEERRPRPGAEGSGRRVARGVQVVDAVKGEFGAAAVMWEGPRCCRHAEKAAVRPLRGESAGKQATASRRGPAGGQQGRA